ncbi:pyridoxamine 5'-phosphate oxidase [Halobacteriales archaeon QS_3_64_16]|nr:MAG: pyridoxamine 5'-phosphate oxidase [Halobacteriales archaeon QS_3_64_16]
MSNGVPAEAEALLTSEPLIAHFATSVEDRPHVAPVWYGYTENTIEVLTTGRKLANIRANPRVALSVQKDRGGRAQWAVTILGQATVIEDDEETEAAEARINPKYGADPSAWPENVLVRIDPGTVQYSTY